MLVQELAGWALDTYRGGVLPADITQLAAAQRMSVYGALAATRVVYKTTLRGGISAVEQLHQAVDQAAALDFDDYVCFGHAGLSSVLASTITAAQPGVNAEHDRVVIAQVVAGELHARIAGSCLLAPYGPTQWAFAHAVSSAVAAGLLMGLDERELGQALAIALAQRAVPTYAAFFGPDTRSLTVANAAALGMRAALAAADGRSGPLNVLDDPAGGFYSQLVRRALPEMLGGLGTGWALRTLSVKTTPSCSYVDPVLDALSDLLPLDVQEVARIDVAAAKPTVIMANLADRYRAHNGLTPSVAAFSVPLSSALLLHHGELTPDHLSPQMLRSSERAVLDLASRIHVRHSPRLTVRLARSLSGAFPVHRILARRILQPKDVRLRNEGARKPDLAWSPEALEGFSMSFPVRVVVRLRSGRTVRAEADVPRGAAGSRVLAPGVAAERKLDAWAPRAFGESGAGEIRRLIAGQAQHYGWLVGTNGP